MNMAIYSYYYGAHVSRGIGVQAQSPEIEKLPFRAAMKELSSMHALKSAEHENEMLSYMLLTNGYSILGASYMESPKSSGYNRSAPCGLLYVAPVADMEQMAGDLSRIINFINFQKPNAAAPAPMESFPLNDSGYSYHNSPAVMSAIVEGMLRVATTNKDVLLIALPKTKSSEYAAARYAMAEAMSFLPLSIRPNIRFFTGLPVSESDTDPLVGFDNAVRFGANVIFCPNEYFAKLKSHRSCIAVDMEQPAGTAGAFARYITSVADPSVALALVNANMSGKMSVDALNKAALRVASGDVRTVEMVENELLQAKNYCENLEAQLVAVSQENEYLKNQLASVSQGYAGATFNNQQLAYVNEMPVIQPDNSADEPEEKGNGGLSVLVWVLTGICAIAVVVLTIFFTSKFMNGKNGGTTPEASASPTAAVTQQIEELPTPVPNPGE